MDGESAPGSDATFRTDEMLGELSEPLRQELRLNACHHLVTNLMHTLSLGDASRRFEQKS